MAESIRPIWKDRIYGDDGQPKFDIANEHLPMITPIIQEGTHHNSGRMNNLYDFDNLISMGNTLYSCTGFSLTSSKITETITEKEIDEESGERRIIAMRITEREGDVWTVTEEMYDVNEFGQDVAVQKRIMTLQKTGANTWKGEIV